ncbi:copper amine oxidase, partial [Klebsiella pneumoniae]|uniref:copper amine oxidase n=1 Tax=Klebsiella pneumoniae TaxID=573 RepID=UPI00210A86F3
SPWLASGWVVETAGDVSHLDAKEDTRYGTLIDHNIVGTTHQHIYNFRLDLDVDGENNTLVAMDPEVKPIGSRGVGAGVARAARWGRVENYMAEA